MKEFILETFDLFTGLDNAILYIYENKLYDYNINDIIIWIIDSIVDKSNSYLALTSE